VEQARGRTRSVIRRPPQRGHHAGPLHENGTKCSRPQPSHRNHATPCSTTPHVRNSRNSRSTNGGRPPRRPASAAVRRKPSRCSRDDLVDHGVLGVSLLSRGSGFESLRARHSATGTYGVLTSFTLRRNAGFSAGCAVGIAHRWSCASHEHVVKRKASVAREGGIMGGESS
jgi:hypothetical protein